MSGLIGSMAAMAGRPRVMRRIGIQTTTPNGRMSYSPSSACFTNPILFRQHPNHHATASSRPRRVPSSPSPVLERPTPLTVTSPIAGENESLHNRRLKRHVQLELLTTGYDPVRVADAVRRLTTAQSFQKAGMMVVMASATSPDQHRYTVSWNVLIDGLMKDGRHSDAWTVFNDMKKRAVAPSSHTYTIMLRGFRDAGLRSKGRESQLIIERTLKLHDLLSKPLSPSSVSPALSRPAALRPSSASSTTDQSKRLPIAVPPRLIIHTNAVLASLVAARGSDSFWKVVATIPISGPESADSVTYTTVFNHLRADGRRAKARVSAAAATASRAPVSSKMHERAGQIETVWAEVVARTRRGEVRIDERLLCAAGRALLSAGDATGVFDMVEQVTGVVVRTAEGGISISEFRKQRRADALKPAGEDDAVKPGGEVDAAKLAVDVDGASKRVPTFRPARPMPDSIFITIDPAAVKTGQGALSVGPATLGLLIDAAAVTRRKGWVTRIFSFLTTPPLNHGQKPTTAPSPTAQTSVRALDPIQPDCRPSAATTRPTRFDFSPIAPDADVYSRYFRHLLFLGCSPMDVSRAIRSSFFAEAVSKSRSTGGGSTLPDLAMWTLARAAYHANDRIGEVVETAQVLATIAISAASSAGPARVLASLLQEEKALEMVEEVNVGLGVHGLAGWVRIGLVAGAGKHNQQILAGLARVIDRISSQVCDLMPKSSVRFEIPVIEPGQVEEPVSSDDPKPSSIGSEDPKSPSDQWLHLFRTIRGRFDAETSEIRRIARKSLAEAGSFRGPGKTVRFELEEDTISSQSTIPTITGQDGEDVAIPSQHRLGAIDSTVVGAAVAMGGVSEPVLRRWEAAGRGGALAMFGAMVQHKRRRRPEETDLEA